MPVNWCANGTGLSSHPTGSPKKRARPFQTATRQRWSRSGTAQVTKTPGFHRIGASFSQTTMRGAARNLLSAIPELDPPARTAAPAKKSPNIPFRAHNTGASDDGSRLVVSTVSSASPADTGMREHAGEGGIRTDQRDDAQQGRGDGSLSCQSAIVRSLFWGVDGSGCHCVTPRAKKPSTECNRAIFCSRRAVITRRSRALNAAAHDTSRTLGRHFA